MWGCFFFFFEAYHIKIQPPGRAESKHEILLWSNNEKYVWYLWKGTLSCLRTSFHKLHEHLSTSQIVAALLPLSQKVVGSVSLYLLCQWAPSGSGWAPISPTIPRCPRLSGHCLMTSLQLWVVNCPEQTRFHPFTSWWQDGNCLSEDINNRVKHQVKVVILVRGGWYSTQLVSCQAKRKNQYSAFTQSSCRSDAVSCQCCIDCWKLLRQSCTCFPPLRRWTSCVCVGDEDILQLKESS